MYMYTNVCVYDCVCAFAKMTDGRGKEKEGKKWVDQKLTILS